MPIKEHGNMTRTQEEIMKDWKDNAITPIVSICCTTYNHEDYIKDAIKSFLMQKTNFSFEILIRDDYSTDNTALIIKSYAKKYPKIIKPIFEQENTYSKGIRPLLALHKLAKGKFIAICEGDDYWITKTRLQRQVDFLKTHDDYYIVLGKSLIKKRDEVISYESRWDTKRTDFDVLDYICKMFGHTSTICCRNHFHDWQVDTAFKCLQGDQHFVLFQSLPHCDKIKYFDEVLSVYRDHPGGVTKRAHNLNIDNSVNSYINILKDFDNYSNGIYSTAISYRIKEMQKLTELIKAHSLLLKSIVLLKNLPIFIKYLMKKYFAIRPF